MEYNGSNFFYLRKTSTEKYYDELVKAECLCEHFPDITKIIVRKVMEIFLKDIAEKEFIEANVSAWNLFNNIVSSSKISFPKEIYNYIEIILLNGYQHTLNNNNKRKSKDSAEILEIMHNILCWYIKKTEPMNSIKDISFRGPRTIEDMENQVSKIEEDISLKNSQINNLRKKIIDSDNEYKNISEINSTIIAIKEEKSHLDKIQMLLNKKIEIQNKYILDMEKNYKIYDMKYSDLKGKCHESLQLLFEKESKFVKAEIQRQELKNSIKTLDDRDESIKNMEEYIDEKLKSIRQTYERLLSLTNEYNDILETVEFSYDKDLQEILEAKKNNTIVKMNFEDDAFNENILDCTRVIGETKRKVIIFREIVNEKIKKEIKYESFYRGFLGLKDKELRIIYTIATSVNINFDLLSKSRELFLKSNEDKFLESISRNLQELKSINDNEIKLILYYKLIKLAQVPLGNIYNRGQFIKTLNYIVTRAHGVLITKKDFKDRVKEIDSIMAYYLEQVIVNLKSRINHQQINEDLVSKIFGKISELRQMPENIGSQKIYSEKFNLDLMSEVELRTSIKSDPCAFLSIMVDLGELDSYKEISSIIFEVYNAASGKVNEKEGERANKKFSNEYFMILLYLSSEVVSLNSKQPEELVPLLIAEIISANFLLDNDDININKYNEMVELWKRKQQKYNDIFIKKEENERALNLLVKEKNELEIDSEVLLKKHDTLSQKYSSYNDEFKKIIMNSEKRVLLPSYFSYDELKTKKEKAENNINKSIDKFGSLKSMVSPSMWKEQASRFINQSNMEEAEKLLIKEAKQKPYFKKEYSVFLDLENQIEETKKSIEKNNEDLKDKELLIDNIMVKINELQKSLNTIKDVYPDVEEGYY